MRTGIAGAGLALSLLAGCSGDGAPANIVTMVESGDANVVVPGDDAGEANLADAHAMPSLKLAANGFVLIDPDSGGRQSVRFGQPRDVAVPAVTYALGQPTGQSVNQECGAGLLEFVDFQGGLSMLFEGGKFAGWDLDGREASGYATEGGIGLGTTRRAFGKPVRVEASTIGHEFDFEGLGGLFDGTGPDAKVTGLWAGVTCIFR